MVGNESAHGPLENPLSDRRFWMGLSMLAGTLACLKTARLPNRWSATMAAVDYENGLVRRGLFGATMRALGIPSHRYVGFVVVSFVVLALCLVGFVWLARQAKLYQCTAGRALGALFFGSYAVTYMTHLVGYLDIVLVALTLLSLTMRRPVTQLTATAFATVVGILVHEQFVLSYLPLVFYPCTFRLLTRSQGRVPLLVSLLAVLGLAVWLTLRVAGAPLDQASVQALERSVTARVDFAVRSDVFPLFARGYAENRKIMIDMWQQSWWHDGLKDGFWIAMPSILTLTAGSLWRLKSAALTRGERRLMTIAVVGASMAPLSLHLVGWDAVRWNAEAIVAAFGVLLITYRESEALQQERTVGAAAATVTAPTTQRADAWFQRAAVCVLLISGVSGNGLLDFESTAVYPFREEFRQLENRLKSTRLEPPRF